MNSKITIEIYEQCKKYDDIDFVVCANQIIDPKYEWKDIGYLKPMIEDNGKWIGDCESYTINWISLLRLKGINNQIVVSSTHILSYALFDDGNYCKLDRGIECSDKSNKDKVSGELTVKWG
jgi:hypothetical protein